MSTLAAPLPKLDQEMYAAVSAADKALVAELVEAIIPGGVLGVTEREDLEQRVARHRYNDVAPFASAYAYACLYIGDLESLIRDVARSAVKHPHGREARMLVYAAEYDKLVAAAPAQFILPGVNEARKLEREIADLRARARVDSLTQALLARVKRDVATAVTTGDASPTLAEMNGYLTSSGPTDRALQTITDCYYPVAVKEPSQLRDGDLLFNVSTKIIAYECGAPPTASLLTTTDATVEAIDAAIAAQLADKDVRVMRPLGQHGALAMRMRSVAHHLQQVAMVEEQLAKAKPKSTHLGRAQGLNIGYELLTGPSWALPPAIVKA